MTTIACDGKMIAGDGFVTGNGIIHDTEFNKLATLNDGSVVGFSGSPYQKADMIAFLNGGIDKIDFGESFEAIILHPDGLCECMDGSGKRYATSVPCATGSGSAIALGAMDAGEEAFGAVAIAAKRDTNTGGEIAWLTPLAHDSKKA